ncbi:MAG: response regulator transcription factor [Parvibaculaceae bacterium]
MYLVDDDLSVLRAVKRLLSSEGFDTKPYADPRSFLAEHDPAEPGCIVLDVSMPGLSGIDLQTALSGLRHGQPVIFISGGADVPTSVTAMKAGAIDFLIKPFDDTVLLAAVREAVRRDSARREAEAGRLDFQTRLDGLTPRERAVFIRVIVGRLNKQIAADLNIVEKTVKVHRARVMRKMGVRSLAELVRLADKFDLAATPDPAAKH